MLRLLALASLAMILSGPQAALAQNTVLYTATYIEVGPVLAKVAAGTLRAYRDAGRGDPGATSLEVLQRIDRPNQFVVLGTWTDQPLLDLMTIDRFGFDVEFLFVAKHHGLRLEEIPVRWNNVEGSKVSVFRDTRRMFSELSQIRRNARLGIYDKNVDSA